MKKKKKEPVYGTVQAAEFLGLAHSTVKYHIYVSKTLVPDFTVGNRLIFTWETLKQFQQDKRPQGRPQVR